MRWRDPAIPYIDFNRVDTSQVAELTEGLLRKEREDERELKRLALDLRSSKDSTLWSLLVDLMQRDTQKHIAILRFVEKRTRAASKVK